MKCRIGCGACCIAISISSGMPGMEGGKPAGVRCIHLDDERRCKIFKSPLRPKVCNGFKAEKMVCGNSFEEAMSILKQWEKYCTS
jgi:Fe-S-cluster containining protein